MRLILVALVVGTLTGCAPFPHPHENVADLFERKAEPAVLEAIPQMRHDTLVLCAERVGGDTTPERIKKQRQYAESLRQMLMKLYAAYYWWDAYPNELEEAVDQQATRLAMLECPARGGLRSGSGYEGAICRQTIGIYEDMIMTAAQGICGYLTEDGVAVSYEAWKASWDNAAKVDQPSNHLQPTPR